MVNHGCKRYRVTFSTRGLTRNVFIDRFILGFSAGKWRWKAKNSFFWTVFYCCHKIFIQISLSNKLLTASFNSWKGPGTDLDLNFMGYCPGPCELKGFLRSQENKTLKTIFFFLFSSFFLFLLIFFLISKTIFDLENQ